MAKNRKADMFFYAVTAAGLPLVVLIVVIAVLNPLWFRSDLMRWVEQSIERFREWWCDKVEDIRRGYVLTVGE